MSYFDLLPEDIVYQILIRLHSTEIADLSKGLKLYVDYETLMLIKYPQSFKYLKEFLHDDFYHHYQQLEYLNFKDNIKTLLDKYLRVSSPNIDILETLYKLQIQLDYPKLYHIFNHRFPSDAHKYQLIYEAMSELSKYQNSYLYKIIMGIIEITTDENGDYDNEDVEKIAEEMGDLFYEYRWWYIFLIKNKYDLSTSRLNALFTFDARDDLRERISRDRTDGDNFNYETKIL